MKKYTIGVDFGTLSGRAVVLDACEGHVLASVVMDYAHGVLDRTLPDGTALPRHAAYQWPGDYTEVLGTVIPQALEQAGITPEQVAGLAIDFTSCTLVAVDGENTPLCMKPEFKSRPQSYVKLWKHHASAKQAEEMNAVAEARGEGFLPLCGGRLSPEWALPKIYETLCRDEEVFLATHSFCEAGEWLISLLTGEEIRTTAFAGLKFNYTHAHGYPTPDFLRAVDPRLEGLFGERVSTNVRSAGETAGRLCARGAAMTGLCEGTPVALPMLDAEAAMPALNVTRPGTALLVLGTSGVVLLHDTCERAISGIAGQVYNGVIPGLCTYEAGQSGLGDSFEWFVRSCVPAEYVANAAAEGVSIHQYLRARAERLRVGESGLLVLDWFNGNRSILQDPDLSGMILGLHIGTRPEEIYRAMIEATAFGFRRIFETFAEYGIESRELFAAGGIAKKDPMLMQIYADVLARPISVFETEQAGAVGSALFAAVAGGLYPDITAAAEALSVRPSLTYVPDPAHTAAYEPLYAQYCRLYDYFGRGENNVMKTLRAMQTNGRDDA